MSLFRILAALALLTAPLALPAAAQDPFTADYVMPASAYRDAIQKMTKGEPTGLSPVELRRVHADAPHYSARSRLADFIQERMDAGFSGPGLVEWSKPDASLMSRAAAGCWRRRWTS